MNLFRRLRHLPADERGSALLFTGLALATLLAIAGLAIDGGTLYAVKSRMQKAANASVLSAAQELTVSETSVNQVLLETLGKHGEQVHIESSSIQMRDKVSVWLAQDVSLGLSRIIGIDSATVRVKAAAELAVLKAGEGVVPVGIDQTLYYSMDYYKEYSLKVDESGVNTGNFGILALGDNGAEIYEKNFKYGYQSELSIGDRVYTQTGNVSGKTKMGVEYRMDQCTSPYQPSPGVSLDRTCGRIILLPIYKPYTYESGQLKQVEIVKFAYFYVTRPFSNSTKEIFGMFVEFSGRGIAGTKPEPNYKGAYAIRLTE